MFRNTSYRVLYVAIGTVATLWLATGRALAFQPVDQSRSVSTFVIVPSCSQQAFDDEQAPDFEPFNEVAVSTAACDAASASASAEQRSRITQANLVARGRATSTVNANVPDTIHAIASSDFNVTFNVGTPTQYMLRGRISAGADVGDSFVLAGATVRLVDDGGEVLANYVVEPGAGGARQTVVIDQSGTLEPGQ